MSSYLTRNILRFTLIWTILIAMGLQTGCATAPSTKWPSSSERREFGAVAVVPARYPPDSNFYTFAEGALAGAKKSAAEGGTASLVVGGLGAAISTAIVPWAAPVWIIMWGVSATAGATAATVEGAARGANMPPEKAQQMRSIIADAVSRLSSQESLGNHLNEAIQNERMVILRKTEYTGPKTPEERPDYRGLNTAGIDTVLEVRIDEIGFEGCGKGFSLRRCWDGLDKPLIFLLMRGQVRLVRVADGMELHKSGFSYKSAPHEYADWSANHAQLLADELELGYRDVAENVNDRLFMLTPFDLPVPSLWYPPGHELGMVCWLYPVSPQNEYRAVSAEGWKEAFKAKQSMSYFPEPPFLSAMMFSPVDSLSPELRWSPFPRDYDKKILDPEFLGRITDVGYDLKIWEAVRGSRGKLVYETRGLSEPRHRLEKPLEPNRQYFWSFRARFKYEGRLMTTRWAFFRPKSLDCNIDDIPDEDYHRFRTPQRNKN